MNQRDKHEKSFSDPGGITVKRIGHVAAEIFIRFKRDSPQRGLLVLAAYGSKTGWRRLFSGKNFIRFFLVLSAIPVLVSCCSAYSNAEYGFSYDPPPGWTIDTSQGSGELVSFKDTSTPAMISITANTSVGASLDAIVAASKSDIAQQQQVPFQLISEKPVVIGNRQGRELLYGASLMGIGLREKIEIVIDRNTVLVVFLTDPSNGQGPAESLFDASIGSITFTSTSVSQPTPSRAVPSNAPVTSTQPPPQSRTVPAGPAQTSKSPVEPGVVLFGLMIAGAVLLSGRMR
jgi:hypothetical protein